MVSSTPRPGLSLADLEAFDPTATAGARERRFCCPLLLCREKPITPAHRSLSLNVDSGEWYCHRCQAGGTIRESWSSRPNVGRQSRARMKLARSFGLDQTEPPP